MFYFHGNVTMLLVAYGSVNFLGMHSLLTVMQYFILAKVSTELHHSTSFELQKFSPSVLFQTEPYILLNLSKVTFNYSNNEWPETPIEIHGSFILSIQLATEPTEGFLILFPKEGKKTREYWCPENALSRYNLHTEVHCGHFLWDATVSSKIHDGLAITLQCGCWLPIAFLSSGNTLKYIQISFRYSAFRILTSSNILWANKYVLKASTNCDDHVSPSCSFHVHLQS